MMLAVLKNRMLMKKNKAIDEKETKICEILEETRKDRDYAEKMDIRICIMRGKY